MLCLMDVIIVESCHSTWVFDPDRKQFCRILKGIEVAHRPVSTEWRAYWQLEMDPQTDAFCVYLNASRTRLIRLWRHTQDCVQCGVHDTTELSLEDIKIAVLA
jgi:hypothetical protein